MKKFLSSKKLVWIFCCILAALILGFAFVWFSHTLHGIISDTNNRFLSETSAHQASTYYTKLDDQLVMLESIAKTFESVDFDNYTEKKERIGSTRGIGDFKELLLSDATGYCMSNQNTSAGNIFRKKYFKSALSGKPSVATGIEVDSHGEDILALSVPIYQNSRVVGVLTGTFNSSVLTQLFDNRIFSGQGYSYLVDSNGNIIIAPNNPYALNTTIQYFDFFKHAKLSSGGSLSTIKADFKNGNSNIISYSLGSKKRIAAYSPVGIHDWYVVTTITDQVIASQSKEINLIVIILVASFSIVLLSAFLMITIARKRAMEAIAKNKRYSLVNSQAKTVIFEYDIAHNRLDLSGDTGFVFGESCPETLDLDDEFLNRGLHPDDKTAFDDFLCSYHRGDSHHICEFRRKCSDDKYYWFRLTSTLILHSDNLPIKVVGNLINVEEQKSQELQLRQRAEHDLLTGLLNKKTFELRVSEFLKKEHTSSQHALFILDLDNFKGVNDTLGHAVGDEVLSETARKLSRIFSEKDFLGRIGGDEFAVFLMLSNVTDSNVSLKIINQKSQAICSSINETFTGTNNTSFHVTASVGVSVFPDAGIDYQALYENADDALYYAKNAGKNSFSIYNKKISQNK